LPQAWDQQREAKSGGLVVSDARRLKTLDDENEDTRSFRPRRCSGTAGNRHPAMKLASV
jgi:hypothetical protein